MFNNLKTNVIVDDVQLCLEAAEILEKALYLKF